MNTESKLAPAVQAALDKHRHTFYTSMVGSWLSDAEDKREVPTSLEALEALYDEIYNGKCEGVEADLTGEDYESIDYNEGWEQGFSEALRAAQDTDDDAYCEVSDDYAENEGKTAEGEA